MGLFGLFRGGESKPGSSLAEQDAVIKAELRAKQQRDIESQEIGQQAHLLGLEKLGATGGSPDPSLAQEVGKAEMLAQAEAQKTAKEVEAEGSDLKIIPGSELGENQPAVGSVAERLGDNMSSIKTVDSSSPAVSGDGSERG
jgi:hypothetical protein